jgi:hypothetical protein
MTASLLPFALTFFAFCFFGALAALEWLLNRGQKP